eukprot:CAMPEP_0197315094 /NCGR_PEP_ID=MMETSP0891-20130614/36697_1 /TAXON_ID=44058 ORGANISM="Aureoumbra lagunensis, Strain CCMP1510" /NCGR_SAMPLE_ID=MMETSP0891 /ASSEMBLY_ACC=CAM_ASM_000534 /LENGTH=399 /DNA_ID=CAMNT_0042803881 /DNA_START=47 /DNA_END=1246 /DNA_ORIENTATION=-
MADHPRCVKRVIWRSQFKALDSKRIEMEHPEFKTEWDETEPPYFSKSGMEEVEEDGVTYYEIGRQKAGKFSSVEIPGHVRIRKEKEIPVLYDKDGKEKKAGDPALGLAYDADGLLAPDWEVVDNTMDADGNPVIDEKGRRRGCVEFRGLINPEEHFGIRTRFYPTWGKCYGLEVRSNVGELGTYTVSDAKLCLTSENFGWELGADADKINAPPLVRLLYGESHGESECIRIYTGMSEIHLDHKEDFEEVYAMLRGLGYVTYHPPIHESDRFWGKDIDPNPFKVIDKYEDKDDLPVTYYSWYFRLPPFLNFLWLEGELGDDENGPDARKLIEKKERYFASERAWANKRLAAIKKRIHEQKSEPWYKKYFGEYTEDEIEDTTSQDIDIPDERPIRVIDYCS